MVICLEIAIKGSMLYCIRVLLPLSTLGFQGDFMPFLSHGLGWPLKNK